MPTFLLLRRFLLLSILFLAAADSKKAEAKKKKNSRLFAELKNADSPAASEQPTVFPGANDPSALRAGFNRGRVRPGLYEANDRLMRAGLAGGGAGMTISKAVRLCEEDFGCSGFTTRCAQSFEEWYEKFENACSIKPILI